MLRKTMNTEYLSFFEIYILDYTIYRWNSGDHYNETMNGYIRKIITEIAIWVSIDETSNVKGRFIENVIVGTLLVDG